MEFPDTGMLNIEGSDGFEIKVMNVATQAAIITSSKPFNVYKRGLHRLLATKTHGFMLIPDGKDIIILFKDNTRVVMTTISKADIFQHQSATKVMTCQKKVGMCSTKLSMTT